MTASSGLLGLIAGLEYGDKSFTTCLAITADKVDFTDEEGWPELREAPALGSFGLGASLTDAISLETKFLTLDQFRTSFHPTEPRICILRLWFPRTRSCSLLARAPKAVSALQAKMVSALQHYE